MEPLPFDEIEALTFDCYGTLVDWERGILAGLEPLLASRGVRVDPEALLELYARLESRAEQGAYRDYRGVLAEVVEGIGRTHAFIPDARERGVLAEGLPSWPPFPDSTAALRALRSRYRLALITNCDDDLVARTARRLGVTFDWVITAEQARSYKPSARNFELALERMEIPRERILHVAQSLYHDIAPARALGFRTVWVNRRRGKPGFGATLPAEAEADLEVPDLATLARTLGLPA